MYARLLATALLLSSSVLTARAETTLTRGATVGVFLQVGANASSLSLQAMRLELRDLMTPTGVDLSWTNGSSAGRVDRLIMVSLKGDCRPGAVSDTKFRDRTPLAFTASTDGIVLPFTSVDCNALSQFLQPVLEEAPMQAREEAYGRAMGRLLAHEFYHVLAQTEVHTKAGISKESFTTKDLMAASLTFEPDAIAQLRIEEPAPVLAARANAEKAAFHPEPAWPLNIDLSSSR